MNDRDRGEIVRLYAEGLSPAKIGLILGCSDYSARYVLDHKGEREKNRERIRRWRARRKTA